MDDDLVARLRDLGDRASYEPHMHHAAADRIEEQAADLAEARAQVAALRTSGEAMRAVVEGISGTMQHGTWRDENGARLKDTPEWVAHYNALSATADAAKRHDAEVRKAALEEATVMVAAALERAADEIQPDGERPEETAVWSPLAASTAYHIGCYDTRKSDAAAVRAWITPDACAALNAHAIEVRRKAWEEAAQVADQQINLGEAIKAIHALIDKEPGHE